METDAQSPFDIEKHKRKLAELKKSPGHPSLKADRRMFVGDVSGVSNNQARLFVSW